MNFFLRPGPLTVILLALIGVFGFLGTETDRQAVQKKRNDMALKLVSVMEQVRTSTDTTVAQNGEDIAIFAVRNDERVIGIARSSQSPEAAVIGIKTERFSELWNVNIKTDANDLTK